MRFLKDRECNNGTNHSTQKDCRAKAPIHISSCTRWDLICVIILAFSIFFGFLRDKFGGSGALLAVIVVLTVGMLAILILKPHIVWEFYWRRFIKLIYCNMCCGNASSLLHHHFHCYHYSNIIILITIITILP